MLRGSSDRYKSLWELTRDIALRALELAACQTAYWKKSSESREEYKDSERRRRRDGARGASSRSPDRTSFHFTFFQYFIPYLLNFPFPVNYSIGHWRGADSSHSKQPKNKKLN